jgi:hypothetical protein
MMHWRNMPFNQEDEDALSGAIDNLAVKAFNIGGNAVTVPAAQYLTNTLTGDTANTQQLANQVTFTVDTTGLGGSAMALLITHYGGQGFSGGASVNFSYLYVNGTQITGEGGTTTAVGVAIGAVYSFTANGGIMSFTVQANWQSNSASSVIAGRTLSCLTVIR